jgi:hypothetical protein
VKRLPAHLEALRMMRDDDEELVYERGRCYVGDQRFAARTAFKLWRLMAVRTVSEHGHGLERYAINETGLALLRQHDGPAPTTRGPA